MPSLDAESSNATYPGDNCCTFYRDYNYNGISFQMCLPADSGLTSGQGNVPTSPKILVSSWWCGKNLTYDICNEGAIGSDCSNGAGESGAGNAKNPVVGRNDSMKWANLGLYDPSVRGAVTAFKDYDCTNASGRFYASADSQTSREEYTDKDLVANNLCSDCLSAVMVPEGYSVILYANADLSGDSYTIEGAYDDEN